MGYELRADLSTCQVDGHFIFLDIQADRYFHLSPDLERTFARYVDGHIDSESDLRPLLESSILIRSRFPSQPLPDRKLAIPTNSAIELFSGKEHPPLRTLAEVASVVFSTRWSLVNRKFPEVLDTIHAHRSKYTAGEIPDSVSTTTLVDSARMFRQIRLYVPVEPRCLLDSISLVKFLARRNQYSSIVFGVTGDPFSAHCWVQAESLVLNDTVGNVQAYQPILVV